MKRKLTLWLAMLMCCLLSSINTSYAQAPAWLWAFNAGYNSYDEAYSVAHDIHGNILVAGYYNTYIFNLPHSKGPDAFIARLNPAGDVIWTNGTNDTATERIIRIATDKLGNYYILGLFDGNGLDFCGNYYPNSNASATDIFLSKFDSLDNCIWTRQAGGTGEDIPTDLAVDSLGNCYITGYFDSPSISFGAFPLVNSGGNNSDLFVARYDPAGTVLWAHSATGTSGSTEASRSIAIDDQGDCYITGNFNSDSLVFTNIAIEKSQNFNMYLAKYSAAGAALWAWPAQCTGDSYGYAVAVDPQNNCYVSGSFKNNLTLDSAIFSSAGYRDVFIAKCAPDGSIIWGSAAGGAADDEPSALTTDHLGYCYLTGTFKSPSISFGAWPLTNNSNAGFSDIFIAEYAAGGLVVWAKSIGGLTNDMVNDLSADMQRNVVLAASLGSVDITIGDTTLYSAGTVDALVAKSGNTAPSGIGSTAAYETTKLYPNPATDHVWLTLAEASDIEILNLQGGVCKQLHAAAGKVAIDIRDLRQGMYFVNVRSADRVETLKLVVVL